MLHGRDGQKKEISASWFSLTQNTFPLSELIQNLKILALIAGEGSVTFMRKKENWTNKGNDKHEDAYSLLHNTSRLHCVYKLPKS